MSASQARAKRRAAVHAIVQTTPMADISFALLDAFERGAAVEQIARRIDLPQEWVEERIEAARLCLKIPPSYIGAAFS
jgi:hypothetical protein